MKMTNEEAIEILTKEIKCLSLDDDSCVVGICDECEYNVELTELTDALEIAVEAMEKQIPKNPIVNGDRNESWVEDSLICPVCNQYFGSVYNVGYCKTCGQKLIQKRIRVV